MKKVKIKCRFSNSINTYKFLIVIYDCNGNLILRKSTNYLGYLYFNAPYYGIYKILVFKNKVLKYYNNIYISKEGCLAFTFILKENYIKTPRLVTFKVTDKIYQGLPIKEGKLILWEKNT